MRATDPSGESITTAFNVNVEAVNHAPTSYGIPNIQVDQNSPTTYVNLWDVFADEDEDAVGLDAMR